MKHDYPHTLGCGACAAQDARPAQVPGVRNSDGAVEPGVGLRGPLPDEAEDLVVRAARIAENTGLPLRQCLAALRDVCGWRKESV